MRRCFGYWWRVSRLRFFAALRMTNKVVEWQTKARSRFFAALRMTSKVAG